MKNTLTQLLTKVWGTDNSMIEYCLKNSTYIDMGNYYLNIGHTPKIDSRFSFSDMDYAGNSVNAPEPTKELFMNENLAMNSDNRFIEKIENGELNVTIHTNYTTGDVEELKAWTTYGGMRASGRMATPEEKQIILEGLKEATAKYIKRLEAYWKRYQNKVSTYTYWADR